MPSLDVTPVDAPVEWDSELLRVLYELVFSTPDREVAGVLVGSPATSDSALPVIRAAIPATQGFAPGQAAMFGHDTWAQIHNAMAKHYQGLEPVGWYISRPGVGTALTGADLANHTRWFGRPDQVLFVVDSQHHVAAIYGWQAGRLIRISEGRVARRYTRPPRPGFPFAGVGLLALLGTALGAISFIIAQGIGG